MSRINLARKKRGMSPGSLVFTGEQKVEEISIDIFQYNQNIFVERKIENVEELKELINAQNVLWININGLHDIDKLEKIGEMFNINPLTMEDILNVNHPPKLEEHEEYLFLISKSFHYNSESGEIIIEHVSFILGKNYLLTFQETPGDEFDLIRERLRGGKGRLRKLGPDYLMYRLLDSVVDNYIVILLQLDEIIENLEDVLLDKPNQDTIEEIYQFRKEINKLRRSVVPFKEAIYFLLKDIHPLIHKSSLIFVKDLEDHIKSAVETVESYKEQVNSMIEIYRSSIQLKLNEILKVLTIISTIFIPLTFIVGVYGMNFSPEQSPYSMPELKWYFGYPIVLGFMLLVAVVLLIVFRKKRWI